MFVMELYVLNGYINCEWYVHHIVTCNGNIIQLFQYLCSKLLYGIGTFVTKPYESAVASHVKITFSKLNSTYYPSYKIHLNCNNFRFHYDNYTFVNAIIVVGLIFVVILVPHSGENHPRAKPYTKDEHSFTFIRFFYSPQPITFVSGSMSEM